MTHASYYHKRLSDQVEIYTSGYDVLERLLTGDWTDRIEMACAYVWEVFSGRVMIDLLAPNHLTS